MGLSQGAFFLLHFNKATQENIEISYGPYKQEIAV